MYDPRLAGRPALCQASTALMRSTAHTSERLHSYRLMRLASRAWPLLHAATAVVIATLAAA